MGQFTFGLTDVGILGRYAEVLLLTVEKKQQLMSMSPAIHAPQKITMTKREKLLPHTVGKDIHKQKNGGDLLQTNYFGQIVRDSFWRK